MATEPEHQRRRGAVSSRLPREQIAALDAQAAAEGVNRADYIARAVVASLTAAGAIDPEDAT